MVEWNIIIIIFLVFSSYYLLLRRDIRKSTKETLKSIERRGDETRKNIQLIFQRSEQKHEEAEDSNQSLTSEAIKDD